MSVLDGLPWEIRHRAGGVEHVAWYQRAVLTGDFRPGIAPRADYAVDGAGLVMDPRTPPACITCGVVPRTEDLDIVNRDSGARGYLDVHRREEKPKPWSPPTDDATCWWCNCPGPLVVPDPPLCEGCTRHLRKGA